MAAQLVEQVMVRIAIRGPPQNLLKASNRLPGIGADNAIGSSWLEAGIDQSLLQLHPLATAERLVILRPLPHDLPGAIEARCQQADCQCVGRRIVVAQDHWPTGCLAMGRSG